MGAASMRKIGMLKLKQRIKATATASRQRISRTRSSSRCSKNDILSDSSVSVGLVSLESAGSSVMRIAQIRGGVGNSQTARGGGMRAGAAEDEEGDRFPPSRNLRR